MVEFGLAVIGVTILLGFLGNVLFERTSIPNTLWLLLFGVALGLSGFLGKGLILEYASLISAIAVIGILSDGGLHLDLKTVISHGFHGFLLMLCGLLFSMAATFIVLHLFGFPFEVSVLVGIMLAGTSASVVIPIVTSLKNVSEKLKTIISLESLFDTFSILIALVMIDFLAGKSPGSGFGDGLFQTASLGFFSALAIGLVFGFAWSPVVVRLKKYEFSYSATLGALVILYALTELSGSSGAIAVFFAGVMIANSYLLFGSMFSDKKFEKLDPDISKTHSLFAFLIRVFFFVFLGVIVGIPGPSFLAIGLLVTVLILFFRVLYIRGFSRLKLTGFSVHEQNVFSIMLPRGLSAAVLSVFALSAGVPLGIEIIQIVFSVILFSIVFNTAGFYFLRGKKQPSAKGQKPPELQEIKLYGKLD